MKINEQKMPSPAEKLAKKKPWRRAPRSKVPPRKLAWNCTVRAVRESLRLSLRDVSKACKISFTALWQIEKGGDPMLTTAARLAEFFGKPVGELWPERAK